MAAYGTPVLILKEGTQRTVGRDALRANILAAKILAEVLKTSLGPRGLDKMLVDTFGDVTITNDGATIVKEMEVQHPAAKLLVEVAKAQDAEVGDGTTTAVILSGALLEKAESLLDQNLHPTIIIEGYKKALAKALEELEKYAVKVDPKDEEVLRKIAVSSLSSKFVGAGPSMGHIVKLCVEAVKTIAQPKPDGTFKVEIGNVKIEKKKGESLLDSAMIRGIVLDKEVVHPGMPRRITGAKIALLDCPLEIEKPEITAKINITSPEQIRMFLEEETRLLKEMVEKISSVGANVVICQKGIDDVAQHFLAKKGILAVRRVKRSDMEKLERATGGRIVSSIRDLTPDDLGKAEIVEERKVGTDKMVFIEGCENPRAVTILLRGANDMELDEAERSVNDALNVLRNIMRDPKIVPGGGAPEMRLAIKLREYARSIGGKEQLAIEAFASALEEITLLLAETGGLDPMDALVQLRNFHEQGKIYSGVDVIRGRVVEDMFKLDVVDPAAVKRQVLKSATEAATAILKIDDVIAAAPPKRTKKGKGEEYPPGGF